MNKKLIATLAVLSLLGALVVWTLPAVLAHEGEEDEGEAVVTLDMGEFFFQVDGQQPDEPLTLKAGEEYKLKLVNSGQIEHEVMIGQGEKFLDDGSRHGYLTDFFSNLSEFELDEGNAVVIEFTVPAEYAGQTFEIGCFIPGHYEAGMKLPLIVE